MINLPLTIHGLYAKVPRIISFLPWKRPVSSLKKAKSLRLAQQWSGSQRIRNLTRDPSIPRRGLPQLTPRKRAHPVYRQPSVVRQRAAVMRGKRIDAMKAPDAGKKDPVNTHSKPVRQRVAQPAQKRERQDPVPDARLRHEAAQRKLDALCGYVGRTGPMPRTHEDTVFIEQMQKMNLHHRFITERFNNRVRLDEAQDMVEERLRLQAEHDKRAAELRARAKQEQQDCPKPSSQPPPPSTPRSHLNPLKPSQPPASESLRRNWALQEEILRTDAERRAHQARIAAGEIAPNTRLPVQGEWSLWEKARVGLDRIYQEVNEERKARERKAKEERIRREAEAHRAAYAREAEARAEEERFRKQTQEQQAQARMKAAWEDRIRRETALAEELKAAEAEKARSQAAQQQTRSASIPFIPPQSNDPELYNWEMYERRWAAIKREGVEVVPFPLRFDQLPWPMFHFKPTLIDIDDLCEDEISYFVLSTKRPGYQKKYAKERLRHELLHYHPDKFNARVLPYMLDEEREKAVAGASKVTIILHNLLRNSPA
ncbi:hypothetical protein F5050DRAFT_49802 [Lentinula boryana]|uniref:Uncharacterized protein n=1 Tax=Lentinula boryana TaxID=40481 RepID=A0ABQ8QDW1_9AGAR|nr:hypothetical protein F5050DRAFT_49802 [Lentinula boryana]